MEQKINIPKTPAEIVLALLNASTNAEAIQSMCTPDGIYVSLNFENHDLKRIMPWAGSHKGFQGIVDTFMRVSEYWTINEFSPETVFGDDVNAAVFGSMTYTSKKVGKTVKTPFAVLCKVRDGKVEHLQFMEDTFATSASFRSGGLWKFQSDPAGGEIEV